MDSKGIETVLDDARHWTVRFRKGQVIYDEGDTPTAMFRVESGCVRLQINGHEGARQIVAFVLPGESFGCSVDRRPSAAEAATETVLTRYSLASVLEVARRSTGTLSSLIRTADKQFADMALLLEKVIRLPAAERVLWFLDLMSRREGGAAPGQVVKLPMSRRDIGDFLGLAPETLSRAARDLAAAGRLTWCDRRRFVLSKAARLKTQEPRSWVDDDAAEGLAES